MRVQADNGVRSNRKTATARAPAANSLNEKGRLSRACLFFQKPSYFAGVSGLTSGLAAGFSCFAFSEAPGFSPKMITLASRMSCAAKKIGDQAKFSTSWATISRHLSVLKDAELILAERNGQHVVYELNTTVFQDVVEHLIKWLRPRRSNA